jgi:ammonia channel protein AmtB
LTRRKNALSLLFLAIVSLAIVSFQWFFIGYSLVFSATGGVFLGDGAHVGFRGVLDQPIGEANNRIPAIVFATYQMVSNLLFTRKALTVRCLLLSFPPFCLELPLSEVECFPL